CPQDCLALPRDASNRKVSVEVLGSGHALTAKHLEFLQKPLLVDRHASNVGLTLRISGEASLRRPASPAASACSTGAPVRATIDIQDGLGGLPSRRRSCGLPLEKDRSRHA